MFFMFVFFILFVVHKISCQKCGCEITEKLLEETLTKYKNAWNEAEKHYEPLWEQDMLIKPDLLDYLYNPKAKNADSGVYDKYRWTNNEVAIYIEAASFNIKEMEVIFNAYTQLTGFLKKCIKFTIHPKISTIEGNYIHISNARHGCSSALGMHGGKQYIYLGSEYCFRPGLIQHLFMHALGLTHEHSRFDRDRHVHLYTNNILSNKCDNFFKCFRCQSFNYSYDYNSVMHYHEKMFACSHQLTLIALATLDHIHYQRETLTEIDVYKLRTFYKCENITIYTAEIVP